MANKCPKCQYENPKDTLYCGKCGFQLTGKPFQGTDPKPDDIFVAYTKTIQIPLKELATGSTFSGRYQIIEKLGKGGMGRVYKVLDQEIGEEIALKLLKPEIAEDGNTIDRFRNELKIARKVTHKNVCRMHDIGREEENFFITMEYVTGEDLNSLIKKKEKLTEKEAISIAKQVCEGLMEAHRLGVVHRDLKPQNIMIDKEGNTKIMDFGIARSIEAPGVTMTGMIIGTPDYISPEQAEGEIADNRSDIYSLGVILYEMVTGHVPFKGDTALSVALKHKAQLPPDPRKLNPEVSTDMGRLILICMEKDRERRYQKAEDLLADLINIEQRRPLGAKIIPRQKPIAIALKPKKLLISALVIIALVIIGVVIWRLIPQEEAALPPTIEKSVAVISFENQTGDTAHDYLQKAIPNLLITNLEQTGYLYVATWERLHDLCKQLDTEDGEFIDRELGMELCRMDGVKALVQGSFTKAGEMFATDIKVLEVKTGRLLTSTRSTGRGVESILQTQIDDLSKEIALGIGISDSDVEAAQIKIADITTSLEAYNYYLKGIEEFGNYLWERSRDSFKRAIELDPTFASAYSYLTETYGWLQNVKAVRETTEKAKAFSDRATEKERLYIEAQYAGIIERNGQKRRDILEQIAKKYPKEKRARRLLAEMSGLEKEIEECKKILEIDPQDAYALNEIGFNYYSMKNFDKALENAKKAEAALAEYANPRDTLGSIYFALGEMDKAKAKLKEAIEISTDLHWPYHTIAYIYALEENYAEAIRYLDQFINVSQSPGLKGHVYGTKAFYLYWIGSMEQSLKEMQKAENLWREVENNYANYAVSLYKGWVHCDRKEFDLARKWFKIHFKIHNQEESPGYYFYFGLLDLKEGLIDSAKDNLAKMEASLAQRKPFLLFVQTWHSYLKAEILLSDGLFEEAVALKDEIPSCGSPADYPDYVPLFLTNYPFEKDVFARAYQQSGELDKAIAEYERLLTLDLRNEERLLIYPKYHYRVAKFYEEKGWPGKAIEQYNKFLEIWKNADPGFEEVKDARKRLAALMNQ